MSMTAIAGPTGVISRFRKQTKWPLRMLLFFCIIVLLAPILATDEPLFVSYRGHTFFPAFSFKKAVFIRNPQTGMEERLQFDITEWKKLDCTSILFAPVPYSPGKSDLVNADCQSPFGKQLFETGDARIVPIPFRFRHFLGTGKTGDDLLSGLIHGTRVSFFVGLLSMALASLIGITLGAAAGYFGDRTLRFRRGTGIMAAAGLLPAWFYGFQTRKFVLEDAFESSFSNGLLQTLLSMLFFLIILLLFIAAGRYALKNGWFEKRMNLPVDSLLSRIMDIFTSLPRLLLILTLAAITRPSFINIVIIIGCTYWTEIARLTRAEMLRLRETDYIQAARALGFGHARIMFRHALPNSMGAVLVAIAFGAASAILTESGLSFLGIGVPQDVVTWGSLLATGKENISAWWLTVFPGTAVFIMVFVYNLLGESFRQALTPDA